MNENAGPMQTDWSMIAAAIISTSDAPDSEAAERAGEAMERLARRYWPAVYAFIRRSGRDVHEAADLTQGFICDVVLGRRLFDLADRKRGRFRSLLLTSLQNYLRRDFAERRLKGLRARGKAGLSRRSHHRPIFAINVEDIDTLEPCESPTPEAAFAQQWSAALVRSVLERVRQSCMDSGLEAHWTIFEHRVVRPMLFGEKPTPHSILVERLDLDSASQASNMMITVKRKFARALYLEVCATIDDAGAAEGELLELLRDLERK